MWNKERGSEFFKVQVKRFSLSPKHLCACVCVRARVAAWILPLNLRSSVSLKRRSWGLLGVIDDSLMSKVEHAKFPKTKLQELCCTSYCSYWLLFFSCFRMVPVMTPRHLGAFVISPTALLHDLFIGIRQLLVSKRHGKGRAHFSTALSTCLWSPDDHLLSVAIKLNPVFVILSVSWLQESAGLPACLVDLVCS